jgi:L-ascorbate metabolism protein UlaG (beta-lactamase superfamily)
MIDPFSKEIGLKPPRLNDTIYAITHDHYDHNDTASIPSDAFVVSGPGGYEKSGVQIVGISSYHDNYQGSKRGLNTIYVITFDEIRFCHLGDLGQNELTEEQVSDIGEVDVLFIPVGGTYTIDGAQAVGIIKQIEPKIIIPMHYKVQGLNIKLDEPDKFFKELGIKPEKVDILKISKKTLPEEETKVFQFTI